MFTFSGTQKRHTRAAGAVSCHADNDHIIKAAYIEWAAYLSLCCERNKDK
jgi:hypothetical protein